MESYKRLEVLRDKLGWTIENLIQFATEHDSIADETLNELGWTMENLIQFSTELDSITDKALNENAVEVTKDSDEEPFICQILKALGITDTIEGYKYIVNAGLLCLNDFTYLDFMSKRLYQDIARHYNCAETVIEQAIHDAIEKGYANEETFEFWNELLDIPIHSAKYKPTDMEFLDALIKYVQKNTSYWQSGTWKP